MQPEQGLAGTEETNALIQQLYLRGELATCAKSFAHVLQVIRMYVGSQVAASSWQGIPVMIRYAFHYAVEHTTVGVHFEYPNLDHIHHGL